MSRNKLLIALFILFICVTSAMPKHTKKDTHFFKMRNDTWHGNNLFRCNNIIENMNHKYIISKNKLYKRFIVGFKNRCITYIDQDPSLMWLDISVVDDEFWFEISAIQDALMESYNEIYTCNILKSKGLDE